MDYHFSTRDAWFGDLKAKVKTFIFQIVTNFSTKLEFNSNFVGYNQGLNVPLYFYRDQRGHEVDIIYKRAQKLLPVEIKAAKTYQKDFEKDLDYFSGVVGSERCSRKYIIYGGEEQQRSKLTALNYRQSAQIFEKIENEND